MQIEAPPRPQRLRRPRRRKRLRHTAILIHRWSALILGLALTVECTTGSILLYRSELFRAAHPSFYAHTAGPATISLEQAVELVHRAHPDFPIGWVGSDAGVLAVGAANRSAAYAVDPVTGKISGPADLTHGPLGWLVNLHDCGFGCLHYAGSMPSMNNPVPGFTVSWAYLILGTIGLLLVLLAISGALVWWPTLARWRHGFRVRLQKGRFARDRDLHNVIGIIGVPFLLLWGITGTAFEFDWVQNVWLTATGGDPAATTKRTFTPRAGNTMESLTIPQVSDIASAHSHGHIEYIVLPTKTAAYYRVSLSDGYTNNRYRAFYRGDIDVFVNAHDGSDLKVFDSDQGRPVSNTFYEKVFRPAHFGHLVNPWWRILWLIFGLTPLALMITGLSTWFFKRRTKKARRHIGEG